MVSFTTGTLIFVEGDKKDEWWIAQDWQAQKFLEIMCFGEMKSMGGCVVPTEYGEVFKHNGFEYQFILEENYGPCFLKNKTTGKTRQVMYFHLGKENDDSKKLYRNSTMK